MPYPHSSEDQYERFGSVAQEASVTDRVGFIRKTYAHLTGAILLFVALEAIILTMFAGQLDGVVRTVSTGPMWLVVLGAYMGVSWLAQNWAHSNASRTTQYAGLGLYIVALTLLFVPLLHIANSHFPGTIQSAGIVTAIVFGGLTAAVFITGADFSFLRMGIMIGMGVAMAAIVLGIIFGFDSLFGFWFSFAMVILSSACILYSTSNVLHTYNTNQHVAASLSLFSSVGFLFYYVVQMFMSSE